MLSDVARFYEINWNDRRLELIGEFEDKGKVNLWFEASHDWKLNDNIIAIALTSLCEKKYKKIIFDLECNIDVVSYIHKFTGAEVQFKKIISETMSRSECAGGYALNFSGGFDSLAAYCLMPEQTHLISMDFGGGFEREKKFFSKFNPIIVKSNFRKYGFEEHSWTFMAIGTILFSGTLNLKYDVWGTVLEATWWQLVKNPVAGYNIKSGPMYGIGLVDARVVNAFTEVGTVMIVAKYFPDMLNESLESLANDGSEKRYRKWVLANIVNRKYQRNIKLNAASIPAKKVNWGTNLALDFLAIYELKNIDRSIVENTVINIPKEVIELAKNLNLNFYERMNTNFVATLPKDMVASYMNKIAEAEILPYSEEDWWEFDMVISLLGKYHNFLRA